MNFRNLLLFSAAVLFCTASLSATTLPHTWVSGSGIDSNPCTFALPCLTFQGALANTLAGGIITAKDAADFGTVSISQSVTIDGANLGSISASGTSPITINAAANVTVQNLVLNGLSSVEQLIYVINGGNVIVDNCKLMNIVEYGINYQGAGTLTVENSRIESLVAGSNYGIFIAGNATQNVVIKNTVIDASASASNVGFFINPFGGSVRATLQNVTIIGAGSGAVVAGTGTVQITDSVLTQSSYGVYAYTGATVSVANSLITSNSIGVCSAAMSKIRLDNNDIYDNTTAIDNCGGIVKTSTTNKTSGTISIPASDVSDSVTF